MKKIQLTAGILIFILALGVTLSLVSLQQAKGSGDDDQSEMKEVDRLRGEWQQLADEFQEQIESNRSEQWYCCVVDPCTYCLLYQEDGRCTCASDLRAGKKTCPECLGEWVNRRGAMYAWMDFRGVYPDLAGWLAAQGGPPATCPMMGGGRSGRGMMGMRGMMRGPMGMMRGMRGRSGESGTPLSQSQRQSQVTLLMKSRELKQISDYNCCLEGSGSCIYCIRDVTRTADTICDCKDQLQRGEEICPECLGVWASGEWNPELKDAFQQVYPSLSGVVSPK